MPLSVKWGILWTLLLIAMMLYLLYPYAPPNPIPHVINQISTENIHVSRKSDSPQSWFSSDATINAEQQILIQRWITELQAGCIGEPYSAADLSESGEQQALSFKLNGESYRFGEYNTYLNRHYLYWQDKVYLCVPTLRPRLEHAQHLWMTPNA